jgi:hypothetical protein
MSEPKSFASLSPSLLARKGGARPAMRPQFLPLTYEDQRRMGYPATALADALDSDNFGPDNFGPDNFGPAGEEDLGWNDMGEEAAVSVAPVSVADVVAIAADPLPEPAQPEVLRRIESLGSAIRIAAEGPAKTTGKASGKTASRRQRGAALQDGRKAAFTLRLDAERHLRLRLACTVENRSAQNLVVEALDHFLETKPGLADLARRARHS